jgi:hypothetical protein
MPLAVGTYVHVPLPVLVFILGIQLSVTVAIQPIPVGGISVFIQDSMLDTPVDDLFSQFALVVLGLIFARIDFPGQLQQPIVYSQIVGHFDYSPKVARSL